MGGGRGEFVGRGQKIWRRAGIRSRRADLDVGAQGLRAGAEG